MTFEKDIQRDLPIPLYYQLKEIILDAISSGKLTPGNCVPTENELMQSYNISRATVRQAMTELVSEGYLIRQKGKGTFVALPKITQKYINRVETYKEQMKKIGANPSTKVISFRVIEAPTTISKELNIAEGVKVIELIRLRELEGEPIVLAETYMPYDICSFVLDYNMTEESLYHLLSLQDKTKIVKAKRTIEAVLSNEHTAKILNIQKGAALQVIKTTALNKKNRVIEYTIAKYRGDRNLFVVETQVDL